MTAKQFTAATMTALRRVKRLKQKTEDLILNAHLHWIRKKYPNLNEGRLLSKVIGHQNGCFEKDLVDLRKTAKRMSKS
jgi:hypothetical protein